MPLSWLLLLAAAAYARICPLESLINGSSYGDPLFGCCHYAKPAAVLCSPAGPTADDTALGAAECAKDAFAAPRVDLNWLGPVTYEQCEEECWVDPDCKIWSFREAKKSGNLFLPGACRLIKESLTCTPNTCKSSSSVVGSKDCKLFKEPETAKPKPRTPVFNYGLHSERPLCEAPSSEPPVHGTMKISGSASFLDLDAGCRHRMWDPPSVKACHTGKWVIVVGGSNSILMSIQFANGLAPGTLHPTEGHRVFGTNIIDIIIEDGVTTHLKSKVLLDWNDWDWQPHKSKVQAYLAKAPNYKSGAIRITHFVAMYWPNVDTVMELVKENVEWKYAVENGLVTMVTQISQWYLVCGVYRMTFCNRRSLRTTSEIHNDFENEMKASMGRMADFCKPGGPAGKLGCSVGSNCYDPAQALQVNKFNTIIREVVDGRKTKFLRFVDMWTLGESAPTETIRAHNTPMLVNWIWQVIYGSTCMLAGIEPNESVWTRHEGDTCFSKQVSRSFEQCPVYAAKCTSTCSRWECAHGPLCRTLPHLDDKRKDSQPVKEPVKAKMRVEEERTIAFEETKEAFWMCENMSQVNFYTRRKRETAAPCNRVSCDKSLEVLLPIFGVLGILGAFCANRYTALKNRCRKNAADGKLAPVAPQVAEEVSTSPTQGLDVAEDAVPSEAVTPEEIFAPLEVVAPSEAVEPPVAAATPSGHTLAGEDHHVVPLELSDLSGNVTASTIGAERCNLEAVKTNDMLKNESPGVTAESTELIVQDVEENVEAPVTVVNVGEHAAKVRELYEEGKLESVTSEPENTSAVLEPTWQASASRTSMTSMWSVNETDGRFPLGLSRFLASLHIVAGHLYQGGHIADVYFYSWGFTWVPWFFMLSGFVLFSANAKRPTDENAFEYVRRRSVTIWPLYAVSLLPMFILSKTVYTYGGTPGGGYLVAQTLLVQSWVPWLTEHTLQLHCWFLSCMVLYWLCFKPLYRCVERLSLHVTVLVITFLFALPWIAAVVGPALAGDVEWYKEHRTGNTDWLDIAVVIFKFHPLSYLHVFVCGMLLANLRLLLGQVDAASLRFAFQILAPISYILLGILFMLEPLKPWGFKLSARLSVLMPLQAGILVGMAGLPKQPLPFLASLALHMEFLADYSYAVYIFQFFCKKLWPTNDLENAAAAVGFYVFLIGTAAAAVHLVQRPVQNAWKKLPWKATVAIPLALAALLFGLSFVDDKEKLRSDVVDTLPAMKDHGDGKVDWRLDLVFDQGRSALINPSVLVKGDQLIVAVRLHSRSWTEEAGQYQGERVAVVSEIWHSDIVIGQITLDGKWESAPTVPVHRWSALRKQSQAGAAVPWGETCVIEKYLPENKTLVRKVVTGPEDPRLMLHGSPHGHWFQDVALSFNSMPPRGMHGCDRGYAVSQMYLAPAVSTAAYASPIVARRIQCGYTRKDEKNWIPFSRRGKMYFVYTPQPHKVAVVREDGACQLVYSSSSRALNNMLREHRSWRIRGSAQAVYIDDASRTVSLPKPHYLALLHIFDVATGKYAHFAYRFNPDPPFQILQLSRELRLETLESDVGGIQFAFVTGLTVHGNTIVITYGAGDREARALVMPLERFEKDYFSCS